MPTRDAQRGRRAAVVVSLLLVGVVTAVVGPAVAQETTEGPIVVDPNGDGDFQTIQAAVDAAAAGDTIEVRPGTYSETVRINRSVELIASRGATLDGTSLGPRARGITILGDSEPTIQGFTITGYQVGIAAADTSGNWVVTGVTIRNTSVVGLRATRATGGWSVLDTTIRNTAIGVGALRSGGNWTLLGVTIDEATGVGVNARLSTGDWRIQDTVVTNTTAGSVLSAPWAGTGVYAANASGAWTISNSALWNNSRAAVDATGAVPAGKASDNWWGGGPAGDACRGNVDCADALDQRPSNTGNTGPSSGQLTPSDDGGGGLPLVGSLPLVQIGVVVLLVVGGFLAVQVLDIDDLVAQAKDLADGDLPGGLLGGSGGGGGGGGGGRKGTIGLVNADSRPVTCRVRCRTDDGVAFQYDLQLNAEEQREARELPAAGPFEIAVQVESGAGETQTFEQGGTDVIVRVAANGVEVQAA
jgi:hypothetical protein